MSFQKKESSTEFVRISSESLLSGTTPHQPIRLQLERVKPPYRQTIKRLPSKKEML